MVTASLRWVRTILPVLMMALAGLWFVTGCTYESDALGAASCTTASDCEAEGAICFDGYCVYGDDIGFDVETGPHPDDCSAGEILCGDRCIDPDNDIDHCGSCDNDCHYAPDGAVSYCDEGTCSWECVEEGYGACSSECFNFQNDVNHCGACYAECEVEYGEVICDEGVCAVDTCHDERTDCSDATDDDELVCADLESDPRHCGDCGVDCSDEDVQEIPNNAVATCSEGGCGWECDDGYWDCAGECVSETDNFDVCDGECIDLDRTHAYCGDCDTSCSPVQVCSSGTCADDCPTGETACSGACIDTQTDVEHCGGCDAACDENPENSSPICVSGGCSFECNTGYFECGGDCLDENIYALCNGACVNIQTDVEHCGDCGDPCEDFPADASPQCIGGSCDWECNTGFTECADQCFSSDDFVDNIDHCGSCGTQCTDSPDNADPTCDGTSCSFTCRSGFHECEDQCFASFDTVEHCGSCGNDCDDYPDNSSPYCDGNSCQWECDSGFTECEDQCFAAFDTVEHCGSCGYDCDDYPENSSPVCDGGSCSFECNSGYYYCDGECIPDTQVCGDCDPNYSGDYGGGEGTHDNPYLLCTVDHFDGLEGQRVNGQYFELAANVDFSGQGSYDPFGHHNHGFEGVFDGGGYQIQNLSIHRNNDGVGVFYALASGARIGNLEITGLNVTSGGNNQVGGLTGASEGTISNVHVEGSVEGSNDVGGLVGHILGGTISRSSAHVVVDGENSVGGLVGRASGSAEITDCYATRSISGDVRVGGLVGEVDGASLLHCYAAGSISYDDDAGALVGLLDGGGSVENSYWDFNVIDNTSGAIGHIENGATVNLNGLQTTQFMDASNFSFDFTDTWAISTAPDGLQRPILQWQE